MKLLKWVVKKVFPEFNNCVSKNNSLYILFFFVAVFIFFNILNYKK